MNDSELVIELISDDTKTKETVICDKLFLIVLASHYFYEYANVTSISINVPDSKISKDILHYSGRGENILLPDDISWQTLLKYLEHIIFFKIYTRVENKKYVQIPPEKFNIFVELIGENMNLFINCEYLFMTLFVNVPQEFQWGEYSELWIKINFLYPSYI